MNENGNSAGPSDSSVEPNPSAPSGFTGGGDDGNNDDIDRSGSVADSPVPALTPEQIRKIRNPPVFTQSNLTAAEKAKERTNYLRVIGLT